MSATATDPAPAYLIKGDEPTLVVAALRLLLGELTGDGDGAGFAVEDLTGDEPDAGPVLDACSTPPFLADRRIVVVREIGRFRADDVAPLIEYIADPLPTTTLVLVAGGGQTPVRLVNAVKKAGHVIEAVPDQKARKNWIVDRMKEASIKLDAPAGEVIREHLGEDIARLGSLLEVLTAAYGEGAKVGAEDVRPFLGEAGATAPWDLTDAIDRGDAEAALEQLHRMVAGGRHPLVVMATLHGHFGAMLRLDGASLATDAEAAQLLGMHPFRAGKLLTQSRRLGHDGVGRAILLLADADLALRGLTGWSEDLVLEVLVARLARLTPRSAARPAARPVRSARTGR